MYKKIFISGVLCKRSLISLPVERFKTNAKLELMTKLKCEVVNIAGDLMYLIIQ